MKCQAWIHLIFIKKEDHYREYADATVLLTNEWEDRAIAVCEVCAEKYLITGLASPDLKEWTRASKEEAEVYFIHNS